MRPVVVALSMMVALAAGCGTGAGSDAARPAEGGDAGADPAGDGDRPDAGSDLGDADGLGSGSATQVAREIAITDERLCDFDDDGLLDNSVADVGSPGSGLIALALSTAFTGENSARRRVLMHFPWVDDVRTPADPETTFIVVGAEDCDSPPNPDDDFSGDEPFAVREGYIDGCGEPLYFTTSTIEAGSFETRSPIPIVVSLDDENALLVQDGRFFATIEAGFGAATWRLCGVVLVQDAGAVSASLSGTTATVLEVLLAGGAILGMPQVPGLLPDVDRDGDGLEQFVLDEGSHVELCIDGDGVTTVPGPACWQDPRMADAFSLTFEVASVSARCAGPESRWAPSCSDPPETSAWQGSCGFD
jgi:hypothetical protein